MKQRIITCLLLGLFAMSGYLTQAQTSPQAETIPSLPLFEDGETVLFLGNSITRGGAYHTFINLYYLTRFPHMNLTFVNAGVSGDKSSNGIARLDQDVFIHQPDKIVMMFGMNDANVGVDPDAPAEEKEQRLTKTIETYQVNMDSISRLIMAEGIELIYIAPSIYDYKVEVEAKVRYGGERTLGMCREIVYDLAAKYQKPVVDFYTVMHEVNDRYQKEDPTFSVVGKDRVHPGDEGHLLMGYQFLKTQGVPASISELELDARTFSVQKQENCKASNFTEVEGTLIFALKANALPFPIDKYQAASWKPMYEELNQEKLVIHNLAAGEYILSIDDARIDTFSHQQLAAGINLALYTHTPQYKQAITLRDVIMRRKNLIAGKIRAFSIFDYGMLKNLPRNASQDSLAATFDRELEKLKTKSYYSYLKLQAQKYQVFKARTIETEAAIARLSQSLELLNKPTTHMYMLKPVDE